MISYLAQILNERKAFVLFDIFEGNFLISLLKMIPFFQQFYQYYTGFKKQILEPTDGLIVQCQTSLKCLPRPILQLAGYPIIFYFFCAFLVNSFRDFIKNLDDGEDVLFQINQNTIKKVKYLFDQNKQFNHLIIVCFVAATYILTYFSSPGYFDHKEDKEELEKALMNRVELKNNHRIVCDECQFPKVARSFHCRFCQKCIAKYEYHSCVFNKCIGAGNHPYYYLFLIGITVLFGYQSVLLSTYRSINGEKYSFINLLLNYRMLIYYFLLLCQHTTHILTNITFQEIHDARRLPYLWKTLNREFFNPFDKGVCGNLRELFLVITTRKSVPFRSQELDNYSTLQQDEKSVIIQKKNTQEGHNSDSSDEEEESKHNPNQEQQDEFEEIGKDKPIPDKYINWLSKKFFTIVDIPNTPMRDIAIVEMKSRFRKEKQRNQGNPQFQLQNQLRINQQKVMRGLMTQEEMETQKNVLLEQLNREREEYMKKQLEQQKKLYETNPERAQQDKQYMEMGITQARMQMVQNPSRAKDIEVDVNQAIKNYIYLYGQESFNQYEANQQLMQNQQQYAPQQFQQQQPQHLQPLQSQPKHVYQPEQSHQFNQQQYIEN